VFQALSDYYVGLLELPTIMRSHSVAVLPLVHEDKRARHEPPTVSVFSESFAAFTQRGLPQRETRSSPSVEILDCSEWVPKRDQSVGNQVREVCVIDERLQYKRSTSCGS
jgi:hypothetical protein